MAWRKLTTGEDYVMVVHGAKQTLEVRARGSQIDDLVAFIVAEDAGEVWVYGIRYTDALSRDSDGRLQFGTARPEWHGPWPTKDFQILVE